MLPSLIVRRKTLFINQDEISLELFRRRALTALVFQEPPVQRCSQPYVKSVGFKLENVYPDRRHGKIGASEGIRTLDTHVGNVMLYQAELRSLPN
jgi:hypothetical protein